jgi:hypothetical protein
MSVADVIGFFCAREVGKCLVVLGFLCYKGDNIGIASYPISGGRMCPAGGCEWLEDVHQCGNNLWTESQGVGVTGLPQEGGHHGCGDEMS